MKRSIQLLALSALMAAAQSASADVVSPLPAGSDDSDNRPPVDMYADRSASIVPHVSLSPFTCRKSYAMKSMFFDCDVQ